MPNAKVILNRQPPTPPLPPLLQQQKRQQEVVECFTSNSISTQDQQLNTKSLNNRKIFCITERPPSKSNNESNNNNTNRHMYLLMEDDNVNNGECTKTNGTSSTSPSSSLSKKVRNGKKVILFADKNDITITKRVEQFLPSILKHIKSKQNGPIIIKQPIKGEQETDMNYTEEAENANGDHVDDDDNFEDKKLVSQQKRKIATSSYNININNDNSNNSSIMEIKDKTILLCEERKENNNSNANKRARITLPPKKFLTQKILPNGGGIGETESVIRKTPIYNYNNNNTDISENIHFPSNDTEREKVFKKTALVATDLTKKTTSTTTTATTTICAETPVIVTPASLMSKNCIYKKNYFNNNNNSNEKANYNNYTNDNNNNNDVFKTLPTTNLNKNHTISSSNHNKNNNNNNINGEAVTMQRYINLTPEFLFFMRLLPKLEGIPEPRKARVQYLIEKLININSTPTVGME